MIYIAHRGLIHGPNRELENLPSHIEHVIDLGYHCEVDLWVVDDKLFLGHDAPQHQIESIWLKNKPLWIHAKNLEALNRLIYLHGMYNYFWHQNDDFTITSFGYIWTYPGKPLTKSSICVQPEWDTPPENLVDFNENCYGVCSKYVGSMKKDTK